MPTIQIDGPKIQGLQRRRRLVAQLTEAAVEAYGLPKEIIHVLIRENVPENVGVGGEVLADRLKK